MGPGYKAIPYKATRHYEAVVDVIEPWNNEPAYDTTETRWCIVSTDTGEVLDDAQGYGYKSARNAYAAYGYKHRDKSKDAEKAAKKRRIQAWMKEHKDFVEGMDTIAFEILKGVWGPDCEFDAALVKKMLKNQNLHPDFTAGELLKVWSAS